jgi:hypothetical protein
MKKYSNFFYFNPFYWLIYTIIYISVEDIKFIRELTDITVKEIGGKVTFECEMSREGLKLDWYRSNKAIRRDMKYDIVADGRVHKLVIDKVDSEDTGDYRAEYLMLSTSAKLNVEGMDPLYLPNLK